MKPAGEERREFQRLHLTPPLPATFGITDVSVIEIGVLGARVLHGAALEPRYADLSFEHDGREIALKCEVVRTFPNAVADHHGNGLASGLRFLAAVGESGDHLRAMLAQLVIREFDSKRLPALPDTPVDGDRTVRGVDARFMCYRLENGVWRKRRVFLPEQPSTGFTVATAENSEEMQRLCAVYEASDDEGRRLIRMFAELSVSDALEIPPRAAP